MITFGSLKQSRDWYFKNALGAVCTRFKLDSNSELAKFTSFHKAERLFVIYYE